MQSVEDNPAASASTFHGNAASVLGDAVQHDLDALTATPLLPMPLPSPDRKGDGSPVRHGTFAGKPASTGAVSRPAPIRQSTCGSPVRRVSQATGTERGRRAAGPITPAKAGRHSQQVAPGSRESARGCTAKVAGAPAGAATARWTAGGSARAGIRAAGTLLSGSPQRSIASAGTPRDGRIPRDGRLAHMTRLARVPHALHPSEPTAHVGLPVDSYTSSHCAGNGVHQDVLHAAAGA